jgi:hypothetical protein
MKHLYNSVLYKERKGFKGNLMSNITNTLLLRDKKVSKNLYNRVFSYMTRKAFIIYS